MSSSASAEETVPICLSEHVRRSEVAQMETVFSTMENRVPGADHPFDAREQVCPLAYWTREACLTESIERGMASVNVWLRGI